MIAITATCAMCEKSFQRKPSALKKNANNFCGKVCYNAFMRKGCELPCYWCGEPVYKPPSMQRERNFCSNVCRLKWSSLYYKEVVNVAGHSTGHSAPHLTRINRQRNPFCSLYRNNRRVNSYLHRRIVEKAIGRKLTDHEVIHHINGNKTDNRLENLMVLDVIEHHRLHMRIAIERYNAERA